MQKVGCFLCMARQYFLCVKMALGSKRLDTPDLTEYLMFKTEHLKRKIVLVIKILKNPD